MTFLRDIYQSKLSRGDLAGAEAFRSTVSYEFMAGINATVAGSIAPLRRWIANRGTNISDDQHARRVAALADIEAAAAGRP